MIRYNRGFGAIEGTVQWKVFKQRFLFSEREGGGGVLKREFPHMF